MNIFQQIKDRVGGAIAAVVAAILFCCCGAMMAFYLSPRQALEAKRIADLPQMDAAYVLSAEPGDDILVSGKLLNNPRVFEDSALIAYRLDRWDVSESTDDEGETTTNGFWEKVELISPALNIQVTGQPLEILAGDSVSFSGRLREEFVPGTGSLSATDGGEELYDGTMRYSGFYDGDLATVLGIKGSSGGIVPEKLFAGDRVEFEESESDAAKALLIGGIIMMICAPVILVGGGIAALLGRRRRLT